MGLNLHARTHRFTVEVHGGPAEPFTALTSIDVEAELVVYPGEGYQVQRVDYVRDQRRRVLPFLNDIESPRTTGTARRETPRFVSIWSETDPLGTIW